MIATIFTAVLAAVAGYLVLGAGDWQQAIVLAAAPLTAAVAIAMLGTS